MRTKNNGTIVNTDHPGNCRIGSGNCIRRCGADSSKNAAPLRRNKSFRPFLILSHFVSFHREKTILASEAAHIKATLHHGFFKYNGRIRYVCHNHPLQKIDTTTQIQKQGQPNYEMQKSKKDRLESSPILDSRICHPKFRQS